MKEKKKELSKLLADADDLMLSQPKAALEKLKVLRGTLKKEEDNDLYMDVRFKTAQIHNQLGEFEAAEQELLQLLAQFESVSNDKGIAKVANELGNNHWARGNLNEALEYYLESLQLLEARKEFHNMCIPLNNIGQIYWYNQDFDKARQAYLKAEKLATEYSPELQGDALVNLGILAAEQNKWQEAEDYYEKALQLYDVHKEDAKIATTQVNMALLYEDTGRIEKAREFHEKSINSFQKIDNPYGVMHGLMNYAGFLINIKEKKTVLDVLERARKLAEKLSAKNQLIQIYGHFRDYYHLNGDLAKAYEYLQKFHSAEMDRLDAENREKLTDTLTRYETRQKEKEAELLRQQNELLAQKNKLINLQKEKLDAANIKLQNANQALESRVEKLLEKWHDQEVLTRAEESLGGFSAIISSIAHQWKQPLNIIGLLIQNLVDSYHFGEMNEALIDKFQDDVFIQIKYMAATVNDFAYGLNKENNALSFSLLHAVQMAAKLIESSMNAAEASLIIDINQDFTITGSESKLIQVLMVILSNALDVIEMHHPSEPFIKISASEHNSKITLIIYNSGPAIPDEVLPHIFEMFYSTRNRSANTGLGLTLAQKIITQNFSGEISCQNKNKGVQFFINLPAQF